MLPDIDACFGEAPAGFVFGDLDDEATDADGVIVCDGGIVPEGQDALDVDAFCRAVWGFLLAGLYLNLLLC